MAPHDPAIDALLDPLAERLERWRDGRASGGIYAQFSDTAHAVGDLAPALRSSARRRLQALADRIGIAVGARGIEGPIEDKVLVCVLRTPSSCEAVGAVLHAHFDGGVRVLEAGRDPATCEIWCRVGAGPGTWNARVHATSREVDRILVEAFHAQQVESFVVFCAAR